LNRVVLGKLLSVGKSIIPKKTVPGREVDPPPGTGRIEAASGLLAD
jgi:hypothetical protein